MVKAPKSPTSSAEGNPEAQHDAIAEAALRTIEAKGWRRATLADIAAEAGMPLARMLEVVPSRAAVLRAILRMVDRRMLADVTSADESEPRRDRLFDLVMRRFEVLGTHRDAVRALLKDAACDLTTAATLLAEGRRSRALTLEAAGLSTRGALGEARIQGLGAVMGSVLRTWRDDDTPDLSLTMKALDTDLDRAERAEHFLCSIVPRSPGRRRDAKPGDAKPGDDGYEPSGPASDTPTP